MLSAILFDMDGVLLDSHAISHELLMQTVRRFIPGIGSREVNSLGGLSLRLFWQKLKADHGLREAIDELMAAYDEEEEIALYQKGIEPISGAVELLSQCKENGYRTALVTSASRKRMQAVLDIFRIANLFDSTICDDEVIRSKPDPQIYLAAASKLQTPPCQCLAIEDSEAGVQAAQAAGMRCIGLKACPSISENLASADWVVTSFAKVDWDGMQALFQV